MSDGMRFLGMPSVRITQSLVYAGTDELQGGVRNTAAQRLVQAGESR